MLMILHCMAGGWIIALLNLGPLPKSKLAIVGSN